MNEVKKFSHPGFQRGKGRNTNPGRQVDSEALKQVQSLLGDARRERDELLENLHLINDHFGYLDHRHLCALAAEMRLSQTEVYEVASFYAHFRIIGENDTPPTKQRVRVCDSLSCMMLGAEDLAEQLRKNPDLDVELVPCVGRCHQAPIAEVGQNHLAQATASSVEEAIKNKDFTPDYPDFESLDTAKERGVYSLLESALNNQEDAKAMISRLEESGLRGMGGAGFPTGRKWGLVREKSGEKLMAVNGDEGEPGTFKDHYFLKTGLHDFLEGTLLAAWVVQANTCYIYLRDEYPDIRHNLEIAVAELNSSPLTAYTRLIVRRGAGAYICGEESAMIESIEGKRPLPRHRPPYVADVGLFGQPTLVNNVETLYWARKILCNEDEGFAKQGRHGGKGWRSYSVSGRVQNPGVKCAPAGITMRELIEEYCGGMLENHTFKGYLPGGASGGILPASLGDEPLDFGTLQKHGCFIGSAAIVVLSDHDNIADAALNLMKFFAHESCGQCTPCRVGTEKASMMMADENWDKEALEDICTVMTDASICGLGQAAGNPLISAMRYFPEDIPSK